MNQLFLHFQGLEKLKALEKMFFNKAWIKNLNIQKFGFDRCRPLGSNSSWIYDTQNQLTLFSIDDSSNMFNGKCLNFQSNHHLKDFFNHAWWKFVVFSHFFFLFFNWFFTVTTIIGSWQWEFVLRESFQQ